jgi:hypothetical protein
MMSNDNWQPIKTIPQSGKFLVAVYRPTSWEYSINTVSLSENDADRHRVIKLKYARAWKLMPDEPDPTINDSLGVFE